MKPIDWVKQQGYEFREDNDEIKLRRCPLCDGDGFSINAFSGLFKCFNLNRHEKNGKPTSGNLFTLNRLLGLTSSIAAPSSSKLKALSEDNMIDVENAHAVLIDDSELLSELCVNWGITEETVKHFKLGYTDNYFFPSLDDSYPALVTPLIKNGALYDVKFKTWFNYPKAFIKIKDASKIMINEDVLAKVEEPETVLVCEGEKDLIVAWEHGFKNAVGTTSGAGNMEPRWFDLISKAKEIIIAYDGDDAGQEGARKIAQRLGTYRTKIAELPEGMDVADVLNGPNGDERFKSLIKQAELIDLPAIQNIDTILTDAIVTGDENHIYTYLPGVNELLGGGLTAGHLITLTAPPKIGKTTFAMSLCLDACLQNKRCLFYCMEMSGRDLLDISIGMLLGVGREVTGADRYVFMETYRDKLPLFIGYDSNVKQDVLMQTFRDAYARYGVDLIVFDNIHYMVRNVTDSTGKAVAMENAYKAFKDITLELNIPIICIAQPRKQSSHKEMSSNDVAWSGAAVSDSDALLILHRDKNDTDDSSFKQKMSIRNDAGRHSCGGRKWLEYRTDQVCFRETSRDAGGEFNKRAGFKI